jgi:hypothetical protein
MLAMYVHHTTQTDSQAFMTLAAELDLQNSGCVAVSSEFDWTPDQSSIGYQRTSISALSTELTPATSKLSSASPVHEFATTANGEIDDDAELATLAADAALAAAVGQRLSLQDVPYASAKPVWQGRNLRSRRIHNPTPCPLCGHEFGHHPKDTAEVKRHLERHKKRMGAITFNTVDDTEATCTECQIHFLDTRDLVRHQQSVRTGRWCGFRFNHYNGDCNGHHPREIEGQANPDHYRFEKALRHWEGLQRRAFEEYVEAYSKGMAPTNAPSYEVEQDRTLEDYVKAHWKGVAPISSPSFGLGRPTHRRSMGSLYSLKSLKSITSAFSTPVRFLYDKEAKSRSISATRDAPEIPTPLIRRLAKDFKNGNLNAIANLCSLYSLHEVSEDRLSVRMNASWFNINSDFERVRCYAQMTEQGFSISLYSIEHLVVALQGPAAESLLFANDSLLTAQLRLVHYAFLCASSKGLHGLVSKLLKSGVLGTTFEMPDPSFIEELLSSIPRFEDVTGLSYLSSGIFAKPSAELGHNALVLALCARQYRTASLLLEYDVTPSKHITTTSSLTDLQSHVDGFRQRREILPHHLDVLQQKLLDQIQPMSILFGAA